MVHVAVGEKARIFSRQIGFLPPVIIPQAGSGLTQSASFQNASLGKSSLIKQSDVSTELLASSVHSHSTGLALKQTHLPGTILTQRHSNLQLSDMVSPQGRIAFQRGPAQCVQMMAKQASLLSFLPRNMRLLPVPASIN